VNQVPDFQIYHFPSLSYDNHWYPTSPTIPWWWGRVCVFLRREDGHRFWLHLSQKVDGHDMSMICHDGPWWPMMAHDGPWWPYILGVERTETQSVALYSCIVLWWPASKHNQPTRNIPDGDHVPPWHQLNLHEC
jgi:hypothetical protein